MHGFEFFLVNMCARSSAWYILCESDKLQVIKYTHIYRYNEIYSHVSNKVLDLIQLWGFNENSKHF